MRTRIVVLAILVSISILASCSNSVTGKYIDKGKKVTLELNSTGKFTLTEGNLEPLTGKYEVRGDMLVCDVESKNPRRFTFKIQGDVLTLDSGNVRLVKDGANEQTVSSTSSSSTPSPSTSIIANTKTEPPTNDLDRQTALALSKKKINIPVTMVAPQENIHQGDYLKYKPLIQAGIISCQSRYGIIDGRTRKPDPDSFQYYNCQAGSNGDGIIVNNNELVLLLGYKTPSQVTGISKRDQNSAVADIVVSFEATQGYGLYGVHRQLFDNLFRQANTLDDEPYKVFFRLYDDGWRIADVVSGR